MAQEPRAKLYVVVGCPGGGYPLGGSGARRVRRKRPMSEKTRGLVRGKARGKARGMTRGKAQDSLSLSERTQANSRAPPRTAADGPACHNCPAIRRLSLSGRALLVLSEPGGGHETHKNRYHPKRRKLALVRVVAVAVGCMALVVRYNPAIKGEANKKMALCGERGCARSEGAVRTMHVERSCPGGMRTGVRPRTARRKLPCRARWSSSIG